MPVIVRGDVAVDGWEAVVAVCGPSDLVTSFDLSSGSVVTGSRYTAREAPARLVTLRVNHDTLKRGTYNSDEVAVVSSPGRLSDPWKLDVFVTTVKGFAQFKIGDLDLTGSREYLVSGRSDPVLSTHGEAVLAAWCAENS
jgi:hypothetical protein